MNLSQPTIENFIMDNYVNITINGKIIQVPVGTNLLQAARLNGFDIPGLCYHHKLSPTGACRLCVVKIKGISGLTMSCTISVTDGMEIITSDAEIEENRRQTLQYLVDETNINHRQQHKDELAELALKYGITKNKKTWFENLLKLRPYAVDSTSPVLIYDPSRCIKCFRCFKACAEVQGKNILSMADRGINSYIVAGTGIWSDSECDGCGECIQLCPTGAIVEKPNFDTIQLEKIDRKIQSTCPYCGVGCQIEMLIQNEKIVRINGVENVSPNDGRLCIKGRFGYQFVNSPERLTNPLIRKNEKLEVVSWDEALDFIAAKLNNIKQKYGNEALAGYASAKCTNEDNYIFQKMVRIAFGNNNIDYCTRLCHASTVTAMLKSIGDGAGSNSIEDFELTDCLLVTGNNIIETHPITATYVKRGKARGMHIIVIDPKWTPLVKYADIWLQPRLGTDVALLNGMMQIIISENLINESFIENRIEGGWQAFEELKNMVAKYTPDKVEKITSVPSQKLIQAARMYAKAKTAMIATGMGMSQQVTGTHNVFSLLNLCFITGQIGREKCGINPPRGQNNVQGATDVGCSPSNFPGYIPVTNDENRKRIAKLWNINYEALSAKPGYTTVEIIKAAYEGTIKALYIMGENPMITDPNLNHTREALQKLELLIVQDIFMTETTPYAHVVLPASSFAEKDGTFVNSDRRVLRVRKAVEMPGNAREDWKIIHQVAKKMGYNLGNYSSASEIFDEIAQAAPILGGINYQRIEKNGIQWPCPHTNHPGTKTLFLEKFNTPSGKAKMFPVDYVEQNEKPTSELPFILNSGRILFQYHSATLSRKNKELNAFEPNSYVLMNPDDARKMNLKNGQKVKIENQRGSLETTLRVSNQVATGELFMPWHYAESPVNKLTRDELDPFSKIAPFKLSAVKISSI